jgi:hypothetical protein
MGRARWPPLSESSPPQLDQAIGYVKEEATIETVAPKPATKHVGIDTLA